MVAAIGLASRLLEVRVCVYVSVCVCVCLSIRQVLAVGSECTSLWSRVSVSARARLIGVCGQLWVAKNGMDMWAKVARQWHGEHAKRLT